MEKLLELLNEFEPRIAGDGEHYDNIWWYKHFMSDKTVANNATRYIVSKEYGFIKRLVDNDKIDLKNETIIAFSNELCKQSDYKDVLMLLAIQDEPIQFLVSILK